MLVSMGVFPESVSFLKRHDRLPGDGVKVIIYYTAAGPFHHLGIYVDLR